MLAQYATVAVFVSLAVLNVVALLIVQRVLAPRNPTPVKLLTYECGELPVGTSRVQFNIRFYVVALIFVVFDVGMVLLYPWAVVFRDLGPGALLEGSVALAFLGAGLAYLWAEGDLDWVRSYDQRSTREREA